MKRRELFKAIGAATGAIVVGGSAAAAMPVRKYGCITVASHIAHKKATGEDLLVYYNGVELHNVYEADDVQGYALVYCTDGQQHKDLCANGAKHIGKDGHHVCRLRVTGNIRMAPKTS